MLRQPARMLPFQPLCSFRSRGAVFALHRSRKQKVPLPPRGV